MESLNLKTPSKPKSYNAVALWIRKAFARQFRFLHIKKHTKISLDWQSKRDPAINEETTPETDELVELEHLWAVEFYTPSHAENLASAFTALGWDESGTRDNNVSDWLKKSRISSDGGGWINLGFIRPPGTRQLSLGLDRAASLPPNVEYATAHLFNLTSSLTGLVVGFVFKGEQKTIYDQILRKEYRTYVEPIQGGFTLPDPRAQKRRNISKIRREFRYAAWNWFRDHAPGIFSANRTEDGIPSCEFLTFGKAQPFLSATQGKKIDSYLDIMDVRHDWDCWTDNEFPGLKFGWPLARNRDQFHSILAINRNEYLRYDLKSYGDANSESYVAFIDLEIKTFLTRWGCLQLLQELEHRLNKIRDANRFRSLKQDSVKLLEDLRLVVGDSIDIAVLAPELANFATHDAMFGYEMPTFKSARADRAPIDLATAIKTGIARVSKRLASVDKTVKELLIQQGNLVSASENIKLQRRIGLLTVILIILTLVLAYDPISKWVDELIHLGTQ
jgi:hypothetical protein